MVRAGALGVIGLIATLAIGMRDPKATLFSYLVAFVYWAGVALTALLLLMMFHTFHAKWMTILRRPIEVMAATIPVFALLFIPIALGMKHIYSWVEPAPGLSAEQMHLLHHKAPYLNIPFFLIRTAIYLGLGTFLARRLLGWSTKQDSTGDIQLTARARVLSAGGLPFLSVAFAFAAFDWLMSVNPFWFSTMFGVYYFAGSFVTTLSFVALINAWAKGKDLYGTYVTAEHSHNIGKLMFAFTAFWGYIAFSQFMLIWIANLPEEIPFFTVRLKGAWAPIGVVLIVGHFFIPFFILLSRNLKRVPAKLVPVAIWIGLMNFVDLYWLVIPTLSPDAMIFPIGLVTAFLGVGGIAVATGIWIARGHFTVPVKDPYLTFSLRYRQP